MRNSKYLDRWLEDASELRNTLSGLFGTDPPGRTVLAPGTLIGLQILFSNLRIDRIALTNQEYYDPDHFPGLDARSFAVEDLARQVREIKPHAVIVSVVTWRGTVLPVRSLFRELRAQAGGEDLILIADYSHAGAAGFPEANSIGADIVCGDVCKWLGPLERESKLAFFWFQSQDLFARAEQAFHPFFLATEGRRDGSLRARWVDPHELQVLVAWLNQHRIDRSVLLRLHDANMRLALNVATRLESVVPPETSILWLPGECDAGAIPPELDERGLVWYPPGGGVRILCRTGAPE